MTEDMRPDTGDLNTLFVYGIFLGAYNRHAYGMSDPVYDVVGGYATTIRGGNIVQAVQTYCDGVTFGLTGLLVEVDPRYWQQIDDLEYGYDRIKVTTVGDEEAWMYVKHGN